MGDFMGIVDLIMANHGMVWDNYPLVNSLVLNMAISS